MTQKQRIQKAVRNLPKVVTYEQAIAQIQRFADHRQRYRDKQKAK